jgi:uncharacterized protein YkwD
MTEIVETADCGQSMSLYFNHIRRSLWARKSLPRAAWMAFVVAVVAFGYLSPAYAAPPRHGSDGPDGPRNASSDKTSASPRTVEVTSEADVPTADLNQLALQMWQMVNQDRTSPATLDETKGHARPLQWDARLAAVARSHSEEMAATGTFSHRGADGSLPMNRVSKAGIHWLATGENIAKAGSTAQAEALFMNEPKFQPNHRGNILDPNYNRVGIGIARASDGSIYITQEFAEIP